MEEGEYVVLQHRYDEEIRKAHDDDEVLIRVIFVVHLRITLCIGEVFFRQDLEVRAGIHGIVDVGAKVFV